MRRRDGSSPPYSTAASAPHARRACWVYGKQHWWPAETPFEVVIGAYLTQNTSWKSVERSLDNLRKAGALTVQGLRAINLNSCRN